MVHAASNEIVVGAGGLVGSGQSSHAVVVDDLAHRLRLVNDQLVAWDYEAASTTLSGVEDILDGLVDQRDVQALRVRALLARATLEQEVAPDLAVTRRLLARADALVDAHDLDELRAKVIGHRALGMVRTGTTGGGLELFATAEPWLPRALPRDRVVLLLNRGYVRLQHGSIRAADQDMVRCEQEAASLGDMATVAKARHNRGWIASLRGDLPTALSLLQSPNDRMADGESLVGDDAWVADPIVALDRASVLVEAGLLQEADGLLRDAVTALATSDRWQDEGEARVTLARVGLLADDLPAARTQAEVASARFAAVGNERWRLRARFTMLAVDVEQLQSDAADGVVDVDHGNALVRSIESLVDDLEAIGDAGSLLPARFMLAEAALALGRLGMAADVLPTDPPASDAAVSVRLRWYRARAELAWRGEDRHAVQDLVGLGLSELSAHQSRLGSLDLRTAVAIHGHELASIGVAESLSSGDPVAIHRAMERAHASSTRLTPVRAQASDGEVELFARLRRATKALESTDTAAQPAVAGNLQSEVTTVMQALREQGWRRRTERGSIEDPVELDDLVEVMARVGATIVSYGHDGAELVATVVDGTGMQVHRLGGGAQVGELVTRLRSDLNAAQMPGLPTGVQRVVQRAMATTAGELDRVLLAPLALDGDVVVIPQGQIALVPWSLLPSRRNQATTSAPCATEWVSTLARSGRGPGGLSAFAGPGLRRATAEATAVAATTPGGVVLDEGRATSAAVRHALASTRVVHLAAHGTHRGDSPLFSSIRMHDGPLFAHELADGVASELVVLSACEVGVATMRRGGEALGFTSALLHAGVATVLAGVANVADDLAHDVMVEVHRELAGGMSPAAAVARAVAASGDDGRMAPFISVGAGVVSLSPI